MLREEQKKVREAHRQKFFNADDAYKRLNRRPTLQDKKSNKLGLDFKKTKKSKSANALNEANSDDMDDSKSVKSMRSVYSTKSYGGAGAFDDTRSMKSVVSMRSAYSMGNLDTMQRMSHSINNLEPAIYVNQKMTKKLVFKLFPSCCHSLLLKIVKEKYKYSGGKKDNQDNWETGTNVYDDARSVLTRHLGELEDLSDVETLYERRQKEAKPPKTPLNTDVNTRRKKYATLEVRKCKSIAAQLSNDSGTSKGFGV